MRYSMMTHSLDSLVQYRIEGPREPEWYDEEPLDEEFDDIDDYYDDTDFYDDILDMYYE